MNSPHYNSSWPFLMAWRDARKNTGKLFLFIASISLGIGAMVGINSFREDLMGEINEQAKALLGADYEIKGREPLPDSLFQEFSKRAPQNSKELYFASMVYFPATNGTRLVQVRALEGDFPYYGTIETEPASASSKFRSGKYALVDEKLMIQYNVEVGDPVRVGEEEFQILGRLQKMPGQSSIRSTAAPVVYIPYQYAWGTDLIKKGSRINYLTYFQFDTQTDTSGWTKLLKTADQLGFSEDDVEERKRETDRSFQDLTNFLSLIAFIALLLGCIGVSSSIYVYTKEKISIIATLRCLGMKPAQSIQIFLIQISFFGLIGSAIGCIFGVALHLYLPQLLASFLPFDLDTSLSFTSMAYGLAIGIIASLLFAMMPLIALRKISPLQAIRSDFEHQPFKADWLQGTIGGGIILFVMLLVYCQIKDLKQASIFTASVLGSLLLLWGIAIGLTRLMKKAIPSTFPYVIRQGLSNLYRPQNQTGILIVTLGLGTAFIVTLMFVQQMLLQGLAVTGANEQPNTVLFDIQSSQKEGVQKLIEKYQLPVIQSVPVVTMRLKEINGMTQTDVREDTTLRISERTFTREYRVTYRDSLISSETITDGKWMGTVDNPTDSIFISIDKDYARRMKVDLGDEVVFNVQGALLKTYVGSFREIDWRRVQTNFLVVFPAGVLEKAPQFHVFVTKTTDKQSSARFQQELVKTFPNVSVIDLELILKTLDDILTKVSFVIRFMALISIATGIIMLISSILLSRFQRIKENVLLRTLGASNQQLWKIVASEYLFLGFMGGMLGLLLALLFTGLLGKFMFDFTFTPSLLQVLAVLLTASLSTTVIGLINNRSVIGKSPLESIRSEG